VVGVRAARTNHAIVVFIHSCGERVKRPIPRYHMSACNGVEEGAGGGDGGGAGGKPGRGGSGAGVMQHVHMQYVKFA
jgi:hypothetical protein